MSVRLFNNDKIHTEKMVRELRYKYLNVNTESAAVRCCVHVGIAEEIATTELENNLENNIVKMSQKEMVRTELLPLDNKVENLIEALTDFSRERN